MAKTILWKWTFRFESYVRTHFYENLYVHKNTASFFSDSVFFFLEHKLMNEREKESERDGQKGT